MGTDHNGEVDRRTWLLGASVATVAAGVPMACDSPRETHDAPTKVPPEAVALMGELGPGVAVGRWTIIAVHPVRHGALPIVLAGEDGARYQVDVLARDPAGALAVANTETLSLYVANRGDGGTPTDEGQGLGAMALARALAKREATGARLAGLSTFSERASKNPDGSFAVPLG